MSKELIEFSNEEKQVIKTQLFPQNASNEDMKYCMSVAKSLGLNPINKEIWFIERKSNVNGQWVTKIEPMAGRDSYIKVAHRSGLFGGIESHSELRETPFLNNGSWETKKDLVATAKVYKKGIEKPFVAEVNYNEYVQKTKQGQPTKFWNEKPHTMLKKVAESQALKKAFNITGIFDEVEIAKDRAEEEIMYEDYSVPTDNGQTLKQLKNKIAKTLKEMGFNQNMIKEFGEKYELQSREKLEEMLTNDELFNDSVSKFERGE